MYFQVSIKTRDKTRIGQTLGEIIGKTARVFLGQLMDEEELYVEDQENTCCLADGISAIRYILSRKLTMSENGVIGYSGTMYHNGDVTARIVIASYNSIIAWLEENTDDICAFSSSTDSD